MIAQIRLLPVLAGVVMLSAWLVTASFFPWQAFYHDCLAALALLLLCVYVFSRAWNRPLRVPLLVPAVVAVAFIPLAQVLSGKIYFAGDGYMAGLYLFGLAVAILAGYLSARQDARISAYSLALVFLAGSILSAWIASYQWLQLDYLGMWASDRPLKYRPYANLRQPNQLSSLLLLGVAGLVYLRLTRSVRLSVFLLAGAFLALGVALTESRTAWLVILCFLCWFVAARRVKAAIPLYVAIGLVAIYFALLLWFIPWADHTLLLASTEPQSVLERDVTARWNYWIQFLKAAFDGPLGGYGWNQVSVAQVMTAEGAPPVRMAEHAHNVFIDLMVWNGWPLGLFLSGFIIIWAGRRLLQTRTRESIFSMMVVVVLGVHALMELPLDYAYFLFPLGVAVGLLEQQTASVTVPVFRFLLPVIIIAGGLVLAVVWRDYRIVEEDYRLMRYEARRIGPPPGDEAFHYNDVWLLTQNSAFIHFARTHATENMSDAQIKKTKEVAYRYPYPPSLFRYIQVLVMNNRFEEANDMLAVLGKLDSEEGFAEAVQYLNLMAEKYPQIKEKMPVVVRAAEERRAP